jgi:hypothetical protein
MWANTVGDRCGWSGLRGRVGVCISHWYADVLMLDLKAGHSIWGTPMCTIHAPTASQSQTGSTTNFSLLTRDARPGTEYPTSKIRSWPAMSMLTLRDYGMLNMFKTLSVSSPFLDMS